MRETRGTAAPRTAGVRSASAAFFLTAALLLSAAPVRAETKEERGKRIVAEALKALGGDAFLAMKDRVEAGRAYAFGRRGLRGLARAKMYTRYGVKSKDAVEGFLLLDERQSFGGGEEDYAYLFSGGNAYEITYLGARPVPDAALDRYRQSAYHDVFTILRLRLNEPGMLVISQGTDIFDNQPVEVVELIDSENRSVLVSFHMSTKLPLRQVFDRRDPKTRERFVEESVFGKYRDVGGVEWPYVIQRTRNGEKIYEMYAESVQINQNLKAALFELPVGSKMLEKER